MTGLFTHTLTLFNKRLFQITPPASERGLFKRFALVLLMLAGIQTAKADTYFANGTGTENDPFQISTKEELQAFGSMYSLHFDDWKNTYYNKCYKLMIDLTLTGPNNYIPAGGESNGIYKGFEGTFDGNNKTITGIHFVTTEENYACFIKVLGGNGKVKNLTIKNSTFSVNRAAQDIVGAFVGKVLSTNGTIENCIADNCTLSAIGANQAYVGGILGWNSSTAHVSGCWVKGNSSISGSCVTNGDKILGAIVAEGGYNNSYFSNNYYEWTVKKDDAYVPYNGEGWGSAKGDAEGKYQIEPVNSWAALKRAMSVGTTERYQFGNVVGSGVVKLTGNCTEETHELSSYLSVPSGKTVNLDLNGYNIDRGITSSNPWTYCPCVIYNAGTLTITDTSTGSPGTITGGYGDNDDAFSGGIANTGNLTINGGTITGITGGSGTNYGSGINNRNSGIVVINGGTISGNSLDGITNKGTLTINGGTISNNANGINNITGTLKVYGGTITENSSYGIITNNSIKIKGTINITGNLTAMYQLYLNREGAMINVDGPLHSSTRICVLAQGSPRVITSGLNGNGNADNIFCPTIASNYAVRLNAEREAVIKVKPNLFVSMTGWTYGDAANEPSVTGNSGNGTVTYTYKAAGGSDYSSTKPTNAGTHTVKASVTETALYLEKEATRNYTVAQKEATLSWTNTQFTYNGTAQSPTATVTNLVGSDEIGVTVTGEQTNAGNHTATASALTGDNSGNYKLPDANTQAFTISRKAITVTPDEGQGKTYGDAEPTLTYTVDALVAGETLTGVLSRADGSNVGNYNITKGTVTDANNGNYSITFTTGKTFAITPKTVGITWGPTILTYNNTPQAPTATATGLVGRDACNVTVTGQQTAVGVYSGANVATANELSNANYQLPNPKPTTAFEIVNPLSMSFAANQLWGTWYGTYNYEKPTGMTVYKVSSVSGTTVTVDAIDYVPANTGVLINRTSTDAADVNSNIYNGVTSDITSLLRSGSPTAYTDYILNNDQFVLSSVSTIGEHRCYLPGSGTAGTRGLTIVVGDNTTDIEQKVIDIIETGEWYDMQGRRIEKPHKKGLYIRDGKKVVIK